MAKNGPKSLKFDPKMGSEWGNAHQGEEKGWKRPKMDQNPPNLTPKWALNGAQPLQDKEKGWKWPKRNQNPPNLTQKWGLNGAQPLH